MIKYSLVRGVDVKARKCFKWLMPSRFAPLCWQGIESFLKPCGTVLREHDQALRSTAMTRKNMEKESLDLSRIWVHAFSIIIWRVWLGALPKLHKNCNRLNWRVYCLSALKPYSDPNTVPALVCFRRRTEDSMVEMPRPPDLIEAWQKPSG